MSIPSGHYKWYQSLSPAPISTTSTDSLPSSEPPMFSGDSDPSSWLEVCVGYLRVSEIPTDEMVDEVGWFLENKAYFWFLDWQKNRIAIPWDEFSRAILSRFGSSTSSTITASMAFIFEERSKSPKCAHQLFDKCPMSNLPIPEFISGLLFLLMDVSCSMLYRPPEFGFCYEFELRGKLAINESPPSEECKNMLKMDELLVWCNFVSAGVMTNELKKFLEINLLEVKEGKKSKSSLGVAKSEVESSTFNTIMASPSHDYGLIIDVWGRGVKKWKLIATYVELLEDYSLLVVIGANNRLGKVLGNNLTFTRTTGKQFRVGDILEVDKDEHFPTDLLLLSLSYDDGACYLKTKNLDGETNLIRKHGFNLNLSVKNKYLSRASSAKENPSELDVDFKFVPLNVDASVFGPHVRLLLGFEDEKVAKIHKVLHEMNGELLQHVVCMEAINAAQPNLKALKVAKLSSNIRILKNDHAILTDEVKKTLLSLSANEQSSHSHCLLRVTMKEENLINGQKTMSHIWLVDLAGNEHVGKTFLPLHFATRVREIENHLRVPFLSVRFGFSSGFKGSSFCWYWIFWISRLGTLLPSHPPLACFAWLSAWGQAEFQKRGRGRYGKEVTKRTRTY